MEKPTAKKGTSKVFKILGILGIILLVLIIAAVSVFLYYKNVKVEIIPVAVNPMNTDLYTALVASNLIEDPVVDIQKDKVVIAFESISQDQELFLVYYAFGAAYSVAPEASTVEVIVYTSSIATNYIISMADISAFNSGALTEKEFEDKVKRAS